MKIYQPPGIVLETNATSLCLAEGQDHRSLGHRPRDRKRTVLILAEGQVHPPSCRMWIRPSAIRTEIGHRTWGDAPGYGENRPSANRNREW